MQLEIAARNVVAYLHRSRTKLAVEKSGLQHRPRATNKKFKNQANAI
jgi:hypothetical protein